MANSELDALKTEILFFMDKIFQSSFAYLGAIAVSILTANLSVITEIEKLSGIDKSVLIAYVLLFANAIYLIFAASCSFAIIKRGLFILRHRDRTSALSNWEAFVRRAEPSFSHFSWNVDNYYVGIFFFVIFASSICLAGYARAYAPPQIALWAELYFWSVIFAHVIPIWSLFQIGKLIRLCQNEIAA